MADKKEEPYKLPLGEHSDLYKKKISEHAETLQDYFSKKTNEKLTKELNRDKRVITSRITKHLVDKYGGVDDEGHPNNVNLQHLSIGERRKAAEALVHTMGLYGVKKLFGKESVDLYKKNHDHLRDHINGRLSGSGAGYDELVQEIMDSDDILAEIESGQSKIGQLFGTYTQNINTLYRKRTELAQHVARRVTDDQKERKELADVVNKILKPHKKKLAEKEGAIPTVQDLLGVLQGAGSSKYLPPTGAAYLEDIKDDNVVQFPGKKDLKKAA